MALSEGNNPLTKFIIGIIIAFLIGFGAGMQKGNASNGRDEVILHEGPSLEEIQNVTNEFLKVWNDRDAQGCAMTYAEDAIFMPPNQDSVHGRTAIAAFFEEQEKETSGDMHIAETVQEVIYFGDWAVMRGLGEISMENADSEMEKFPFKWMMLSEKNEAGEWKSLWDIYNDN